MPDKNTMYSMDANRRKELINKLTVELITLRAKAGIPQEELAKIIGVSRQTYGAIERKDKVMSWATYLALIFYFEHNNQTAPMLRQTGVFPDEFILSINNGEPFVNYAQSDKIDPAMNEMIENLDERGLHSLKTMLMVEYARCKRLPGDYVVRAFDGKGFDESITQRDINAEQALKRIREKRKEID
ncbi:MAG: helix-turn-helix domain-containing protein [Eubacterium sp.]|nr:helix-turn-helix domain-containing protein [Eubacterium sp.]